MMNKRVIIISLIILLVAACTVIAKEFLLVKNEGEPLRTDPGGSVIAQVPKNSKLEVINSSEDWVQVKGKVEVQGWVRKTATTLDDEASNPPSGTEIGEDFVYDNINFINANGVVKVTGEMTNQSDEDYHIVTFFITAYNQTKEKVASGYINIGNFSAGETKSFTSVLNGKYSEISDYKIKLVNK